jgi:hypothetical protein
MDRPEHAEVRDDADHAHDGEDRARQRVELPRAGRDVDEHVGAGEREEDVPGLHEPQP